MKLSEAKPTDTIRSIKSDMTYVVAMNQPHPEKIRCWYADSLYAREVYLHPGIDIEIVATTQGN